jgi:dTDP-glucose 4,6-dehydratase
MCLLIAYYRDLGAIMRLLVTGGAGFIGSNFVRTALATRSDVQITVLDALTYAGRLSNLAGLEGKYDFIHGNICDSAVVDSLVSKTDVVIHFAAESHNDNSLKSPRPFIDTNVIGTFELIKACVNHDVRFHHISTDEVFGDLALDGIDKFTRDTPYNPSSPYSASKASSDHLVRAWTRSFGLRATISNCSNNFGPYQHEEKLIPRMVGLIASGAKPELYGNGANVRDWIHVDDHNEGVWAVIEKGEIGQTYLLGANNQRSNLDVVRALLRIMDKPEDFIAFIEDRPGHDLRYAIDASDTEAELGWKPKHGNFEEKLAETVEFYTNQSEK